MKIEAGIHSALICRKLHLKFGDGPETKELIDKLVVEYLTNLKRQFTLKVGLTVTV
jgi:hypothetical protein